MFDYGTTGYLGFMLGLDGVISSDFDTYIPGPNTEVAQVNWDGSKTLINWTRVNKPRTEDGVQVIELNNYARSGSSGGGVFWNGNHIANNWSSSRVVTYPAGETSREYSVAALNSLQVAR